MNRIIQTGALAALLSGIGVTGAQAAPAASAAVVQHGQEVFGRWCAPCHGRGPGDSGRANLPGTEALAVRYKGEKPAALEDRTDLPPDVLRVFVRQGIWSMPAFRKTELSDADIDAVAAYLADSAKKSAAAKKR